jgi:cell division transport system permease protein
MTVTFQKNASDAVVQQARFFLANLPDVESVQYLSAEEVLASLQKAPSDDVMRQAVKELGENPLGPQLIVRARRVDAYASVTKALRSPQYASVIQDQIYQDHTQALAWLEEMKKRVRLGGGILVSIFSLFGLFMIFQAVRVAVFSHRAEIGIMRLMGASGAFIRWPFVLEGIWLVCLAWMVAMIVSFVAVAAFAPLWQAWAGWSVTQVLTGSSLFWTAGLLELGIGVGVAGVVSALAVGRHFQ